jgi:hypothetical protein
MRALEEVAADLAASEDSALFARRWERPPPPLRALEVKPWDADVAGGAEVVFADGAGPSLAMLEAAYGMFEERPQLFSGTRLRLGRRSREGAAGVEIAVYGSAGDDEPLERVHLHREWAPPGGWDAP